MRCPGVSPSRNSGRKCWPAAPYLAVVATKAPRDIGFALLGSTGLILAVPFAVATASPLIGDFVCADRYRPHSRGKRPAGRTAAAAPAGDRGERPGGAHGDPSPGMFEFLRTLRGIVRSLRIYYGNRQHGPAMDRLYRQFVRPDDLVFDIGAHVGDRVAAFRRLGARIVAVEPQPALAKTLRLFYGRDPKVTIEETAVGRQSALDRAQSQYRQPDRLYCVVGFHCSGGSRTRLAGPSVDQAPARSAHHPRRLDRAAWRAGFHQDRRRRFRGRGLGRSRPARSSTVFRVHADPARYRARLHRTLHRAGLCPIQRDHWERAKPWCMAIGPTRMRSRAGLPHCRPRPIPGTSMRVWADVSRHGAADRRNDSRGLRADALCLLPRRHDL